MKADMPTKEATTSLQQHFQHEFVNEDRAVYTKVLLEGGNPEVHLLASLPPPPHFQVWEPDKNGFPRRWHRLWTRTGPDQTSTAPQVYQQEEEPRMAASADHSADTSKLTCQGATLLGYFWTWNVTLCPLARTGRSTYILQDGG